MVFSGRSFGKKVRVVRRVRIHSKVSMHSSLASSHASSCTPRVSATILAGRQGVVQSCVHEVFAHHKGE
jgi:hypothetical protein